MDDTCKLGVHGPFYLPVVSTHDTQSAPHIYCSNCAKNCSHFFDIEKSNGHVAIANKRNLRVTLRSYYSDVVIEPRASVTFHGRYFRKV